MSRTAPTASPLVVQLISDFNADVFGRYLEHDETPPTVSVRIAPFGQVVQTLTADETADAEEQPADVAVVWARPEAVIEPFARRLRGETVTDEAILAAVDRYADALLAYRRRLRYLLAVQWTLADRDRGAGMLELRPGVGARHALLAMTARLAERLATDAGSFLLPAEAWLRAAGAQATPHKAWLTTKVPFANAVFQAAAADVKGALLGLAGQSRKLIVLDLDDTLWGGIVGDVGWQRLRLGGHDHLGEAFRAFQHALLALARRGIQLAIVSKNEESVALEAIDRHPEMILRRDHFASWRISWDDKAAGVAALADELSLGLDAIVFIDDSPAERARVADALPAVSVPEWPRDPARYVDALAALRCFEQPAVSAEDRARGAMYAAERARKASHTDVGSLDEWLAGLDLRVTREPLGAGNLPRTAQLLNKTNQMNLSTRRLSENELAAWADAPGHVLWTFRVHDRFGDAGLVGILGLSADGNDDSNGSEEAGAAVRIVDFVLSCRVMGRKVEETMLACAAAHVRAIGAARLVAHYWETPRNRPCRRFLERSGMVDAGGGRFVLERSTALPIPDAVTLIDVEPAAP